MRFKGFTFVYVVACLLMVTSAFAQGKAGDSVTGTWSGSWGPSPYDRNQVTVDLKFEGKALTGNVNSEGTIVAIKNGTYDAKTGAVHMEADARGRGGQTVHFVIEGKVDKNTMSGSWNHDNRKGDFTITKK